MEKIKKPKDAGEAFVQKQVSMQKRFSEKDIGMATGNALTNAVSLAIAILGAQKGNLATKEDYQEEIAFWLNWLYKTSAEKKEYEAIPVLNETASPATSTEAKEEVEAAEYFSRKMEEENQRKEAELLNNNLLWTHNQIVRLYAPVARPPLNTGPLA